MTPTSTAGYRNFGEPCSAEKGLDISLQAPGLGAVLPELRIFRPVSP